MTVVYKEIAIRASQMWMRFYQISEAEGLLDIKHASDRDEGEALQYVYRYFCGNTLNRIGSGS